MKYNALNPQIFGFSFLSIEKFLFIIFCEFKEILTIIILRQFIVNTIINLYIDRRNFSAIVGIQSEIIAILYLN
jgi:hypothetical protein